MPIIVIKINPAGTAIMQTNRKDLYQDMICGS